MTLEQNEVQEAHDNPLLEWVLYTVLMSIFAVPPIVAASIWIWNHWPL
jgi:hypothetical protein